MGRRHDTFLSDGCLRTATFGPVGKPLLSVAGDVVGSDGSLCASHSVTEIVCVARCLFAVDC